MLLIKLFSARKKNSQLLLPPNYNHDKVKLLQEVEDLRTSVWHSGGIVQTESEAGSLLYAMHGKSPNIHM